MMSGIDMFYSEAWTLVHYLTFAPGMEQGKKLSNFTARYWKGKTEEGVSGCLWQLQGHRTRPFELCQKIYLQ